MSANPGTNSWSTRASASTACTTGELWKGHPEKALGLRTDWIGKNPNAAKALMMAVMEAQIWADSMDNKEEMSAILGKRQWFNVPPKDVAGRLKGTINYGNGRLVENTGLEMKFWKDQRLLSVQEPRRLVPHRRTSAGQIRTRYRYQGAGRQGQPRGHLARSAADLGIAAADIPASSSRGPETFFDGKVFDPENRRPISTA